MNQEKPQENAGQDQQNEGPAEQGANWGFLKGILFCGMAFMLWKSREDRSADRVAQRPIAAHQQQTVRPGQRVFCPPGTRPAPKTGPLASPPVAKPAATKAETTAKFWSEVFEPLYVAAFVDTPKQTDSFESMLADYEQKLDRFAKQSRSAAHASADADLFDLTFSIIGAQRSLVVEIVEIFSEAEALIGKKFEFASDTDLESSQDEFFEMLNAYVADPSSVREKLRPGVDQFIAAMNRNAEYIEQSQLMQIRMQERYSGQIFKLPLIEEHAP